MSDLRIEITDAGQALYVGLDPPTPPWNSSAMADNDLVTVDYAADGRVLGVEMIGSEASKSIQAILRALLASSPGEKATAALKELASEERK